MKKFTFSGVLLSLFTICAFAQIQSFKKVNLLYETKVVSTSTQKTITSNDYFQDFQTQPITDITNIKVDANVQAANPTYLVTFFAAGWNTALSLGDANKFAASSSIFTPAGTANRWLMTPGIAITASGASLSWRGMTVQQTAATLDNYEVRITNSIAGATPVVSDFTGAAVFTQTAGEPVVWTDHTYTLPGTYTPGTTLYVAFRHTSNNKQILGIDDIRVGANILNDISAQTSFIFNSSTGYCGLIPRAQIAPVYFGQDVKNLGSNTQTNTTLTADVYTMLGSINVFTGISPVYPSLASLANDTLYVSDQYNPLSSGTGYEGYQVVFNSSSAQTDENPDNNKDTLEFIVTDNDYCHAYNISTYMSTASLVSIGGTTGTILGNLYNFPATQIIDSLYMMFYTGTSTTGVSVKAKVYEVSTGIPVEVATSASHAVIPADISSTTTLVQTKLALTNEYTVQAGSDIIAGFELTFGTNTVVFLCDGISSIDGVNMFYLPTNSQGADWFTVTSAVPFIGMIVKDDPTMVNITSSNKAIAVYPNPTTGKLNVVNAENTVVTLYNMLGQEVVKMNAVASTSTIDISNLAEGSYFVKIQSKDNVVTKKINLVK